MEKLQKSRQKPSSYEQGEKLSRELKAVKYVECSALTQVYKILISFCKNNIIKSIFCFIERLEECFR
jgi:hypothetical protein